MVGLQTLDLAIGVRVPASQPTLLVINQKLFIAPRRNDFSRFEGLLIPLDLIDRIDHPLDFGEVFPKQVLGVRFR